MTFDLYNFQKPHSPGGRLGICSADLGAQENHSPENSPWGGANTLLAHSLIRPRATKFGMLLYLMGLLSSFLKLQPLGKI